MQYSIFGNAVKPSPAESAECRRIFLPAKKTTHFYPSQPSNYNSRKSDGLTFMRKFSPAESAEFRRIFFQPRKQLTSALHNRQITTL